MLQNLQISRVSNNDTFPQGMPCNYKPDEYHRNKVIQVKFMTEYCILNKLTYVNITFHYYYHEIQACTTALQMKHESNCQKQIGLFFTLQLLYVNTIHSFIVINPLPQKYGLRQKLQGHLRLRPSKHRPIVTRSIAPLASSSSESANKYHFRLHSLKNMA